MVIHQKGTQRAGTQNARGLFKEEGGIKSQRWALLNQTQCLGFFGGWEGNSLLLIRKYAFTNLPAN